MATPSLLFWERSHRAKRTVRVTTRKVAINPWLPCSWGGTCITLSPRALKGAPTCPEG